MSEAASMNVSTAVNAFDRVARSYDELFTRSAIGQAQRKQVWQRLLQAFAPGERILELNCGTGEDARFLARQGRRIVACDASAAMIDVAVARTKMEAAGADITFRRLANEDLSILPRQKPFDGAYSNFSGLNCAADLGPIARNLASLVRPGGRVLLCVWSRMCAWEIVWYLLHGQSRKAFRRLPGRATARVGELTITVCYPKAREVQRAFGPWFALERRRAIGLFVPPSYAEEWAQKHKTTLRNCERLDTFFAPWPVLRDVGDHILLEFTRCSQ
jgi:SAM-dependent methyltransferase